MRFDYGRMIGFAGLRNYRYILTDPSFYVSLKATAFFVVGSVVGQLVLAMIFALIIYHAGRLESVVRLIVMLPYMVALVAGGVTFRWLLNAEFGLVNAILLFLGVIRQPINFLGEPGSAMVSIIGAHLWSATPFSTIILLAGMKAIPANLYESAQIDGAGFFTRFFRITIPLIRQQIFVVLLIRTMFSFRHFALPFSMTEGGPGGTTRLLAVLLQEKMQHLLFGYNSALSVIMMIITLGIAGFYLKMMTLKKA
jgi:ABC-type sugar transport system permease subunit